MNRGFGKLTGALFGLLLGGPIGALVGIVIGHAVDRQLANPLNRFSFSNPAAQAQAQHVFFDTCFSVMGHIAKADGRVSESEIRVAERVMRHLQLNEARRQEAIMQFSLGKQAEFNLDASLGKLISVCHAEPMLIRLFFEIQVQAAMADGILRSPQARMLQHIARALGIQWIDFSGSEQIFGSAFNQQSHYQQRVRQPSDQLADPYGVIGVPSSATNEEVKQAYRRLMKNNHPDKLMSKGLPPEMIKLATEKTQRIQKAYDQICKARGLK